ncbi:MAG: NTP transferase domain-containing protein [Chloroflexota bacterium]
MTTAIVLAGGASSRFGGDKLAADLDGAPVLHHALRAVADIADGIVLVLAPGAPVPTLPPELEGRLVVARDAEPGRGPLAGLAAGLAAPAATIAAGDLTPIRDHPPRITLVVGGDMPWLVPGVLRHMVERLEATTGLAAITLDASPPAPLPMAVRAAAAGPATLACLAGGRRSLRALLDALHATTLPADDWRALDPGGATLRDIDTPDDLAR